MLWRGSRRRLSVERRADPSRSFSSFPSFSFFQLILAPHSFMANVHPFFGGLPIDEAADWTWLFFEGNDVNVAAAAPNNPDVYIDETGWPSNSLTAENMTYEAATAGVPELQTFLDTYPCVANTNGTHYFFFSGYDEPVRRLRHNSPRSKRSC